MKKKLTMQNVIFMFIYQREDGTAGLQHTKLFTLHRLFCRGVKLMFTGSHISLLVAFKGPDVILGLYKCNYSLTVKLELGAALGQKQGSRPDLA